MSKIAVIGAGISGMAAAYFLSRKHRVWLYEREPRLGGHTHTHAIETSRGTRAIDTGFIVHNDRTYPNLVRLFAELGVERQKSDMSFGVCDRASGMEYSSRGLNGFFAVRRNLFRPRHYGLFAEIVRFNRESGKWLEGGGLPEMTMGEYLREFEYDSEFVRLYLYPMASAVWSTSLDRMAEFPAVTLLRFFLNHGFLTVNDHPQWYVVKGGSSSYIAPLTAPYRERVVTGCSIRQVHVVEAGAVIEFADGGMEKFDEVVFACHGPQALQLIAVPTEPERAVMGCFETSANLATLHTDEGVLPRKEAARASWNYMLGNAPEERHRGKRAGAPTLTYHMNRLQGLDTAEEYCVTLNDAGGIDRHKVLAEMNYFHPLYTLDAVMAQQRWAEVSGVRHLHFCGAYWFYGFHEDGLNSAIRVAGSLGVEWIQ
jgi:predicted NAD/FAD-binding protein